MKNIITATIVFYFKGVKFSPELTLELDTYMQSGKSVPNLYPLIANENNIDLYSYEYEMMQAEPIQITHAEGLVANYIVDGTLDIEAFKIAWGDQQVITTIEYVVDQHGIGDIIQQHPQLKTVLFEIYKLGEKK